MGRKCAVLSCKNHHEKDDKRGLSYHWFPSIKSNPQKWQLWLSAIGRPNYNPPKNAVICSIHFKSNYFKSNGKAKRLKEDAIPTELISGSFNGTGLYCNIPAGFELQMYNNDQKLVFRKDYIPDQIAGPIATVTSSGYSCGTMESMSMSEGCESEMTMKSGWTEVAITSEDKCRSNEVIPSKDVSESISSKNFESKLKMKSGDNQMSKEVIPSGDMCQADEVIHLQEVCESEEKMAVDDICEPEKVLPSQDFGMTKDAQGYGARESMKENLVTEDFSLEGLSMESVSCVVPSTDGQPRHKRRRTDLQHDSLSSKEVSMIQMENRRLRKKIKDLERELKNFRDRIKRLEIKTKAKDQTMDELHSLCPNNNVMKTVLKYRNKPWLVPIDSDVPQNDKYISEVRSFASSIHYYSLKSYGILRKWIRLPAPSTLRGWCSSVQCLPGFQPEIWAELKARVLNDKKIMASLAWWWMECLSKRG